jgi:2-polyprenyl-3-methyl-5-hydroxy-6-metoxy-1,4-benzoquinol methylase
MHGPTAGYYENPREDVFRELQGSFGSVLDIGCGAGAFSSELRKAGRAQSLHGVELAPEAAAQAEKVLDRVWRVDLSAGAADLPGNYDLVLCLDVLEHMQDPWAAVRRVRSLVKEDGLFVVSLPNVRNFRVLLPLLFFGRWDYGPAGILDRTHLRFFTKATARAMLEQGGFVVERVASPSLRPLSRTWCLNLLTLGLFRGLLEFQYLFFARPHKGPANAG